MVKGVGLSYFFVFFYICEMKFLEGLMVPRDIYVEKFCHWIFVASR